MVFLVLFALDDVSSALSQADTTVDEVRSALERVQALEFDDARADCVEDELTALGRLERATERAWTGLHASVHDDSSVRGRLHVQRLEVAGRRAQEAEARALACMMEPGIVVEEPPWMPSDADRIEPVSLY